MEIRYLRKEYSYPVITLFLNRVRIVWFLLVLFISGVFFYQSAWSQSVPVGSFIENQLRIQQLAGDSLSYSFTNRPIEMGAYSYSLNHSSLKGMWGESMQGPTEHFKSLTLGVYNPVFKNTFNSELPYGDNNGAAWYGRGLTSELHAGFYLSSKYVTLTFRPDIVYQQNRSFKVPRFVPHDSLGNVEYGAEALGFRIDSPWRFGPSSYWTFDWGETSLRFHYKKLEAGFSTEPLWWGPGVRYALIMSNNAAGVKHIFIGSRAPIQLPWDIGKFEFSIIWGWPHDSKYFIQSQSQQREERLWNDTRNRFMTGMNVVFSPSFAPHLYLGLTRVYHQYIQKHGLQVSDFLDIFQPFQKKNVAKEIGNFGNDTKNQLASVYLRWVFPESHAEIYGEYARDDHSWDLRDFLMEPDHTRAYTIGFQKLLMSNWIDFFKVNLELNSTQPTLTEVVRPQVYFYSHYLITEGHTNEGQILGVAIGPGSQSQFLGVDGYFDAGKIGLFVQRVVDNNQFHFEYNMQHGIKDWWNHWVKLNIGVDARYKIDQAMLFGKIVWDKNYNYGRYYLGDVRHTNDDLVNVQAQLGIQYLF